MSEAKVYVKFPKAGLGNMMLTWSRAYVFARLNNLEMHCSSWTAIHPGALLRRESKTRFYFGYFIEGSFLKRIRFFIYHQTRNKIVEPQVKKMNNMKGTTLFIFNKIFTDYDFYKEIRPYKDLVKKGIFEILQPAVKKQYYHYKKPVIGMHIRRGDFKRASVITPLSFFIDVVNGLRKDAGWELPVTVFTDADPSELQELLKLNNVAIAEPKPDILDILLLANSDILVLSIGSTFSYWSAFLSDGTIIRNEAEWHVPFRQANDTNHYKEIVWTQQLKIKS